MDLPRFPTTTGNCDRCGAACTLTPVLMGNHGVNPSFGHVARHATFLCEPCALSDLPDDGEDFDPWDAEHKGVPGIDPGIF